MLNMYIVAHKKYRFPVQAQYKVIQVGRGEKFASIRDNVGDSIENKNKSFCELTALYWIWKNDISQSPVGICHYRRYFDFRHSRNGEYTLGINHLDDLDKLIIPTQSVENLKPNEIILPCPVFLGRKKNMYQQFGEVHNIADMQMTKEIILNLYPEYERTIMKSLNRHWMYAFNMFIMEKQQFNKYMTWLFSIMFEVEKKIKVEDDVYQGRVFGFLAERLLNIYIDFQNFNIKEMPYVFISEKNPNEKTYTSIRKMIFRRDMDLIKAKMKKLFK